MKELKSTHKRPPGRRFDNLGFSLIVHWMQPLRLKAFGGFAAASALLLATVGYNSRGADSQTPANSDQPVAAADASTDAAQAPTTAQATAEALKEVGAVDVPASSSSTNGPAITKEIPPAQPKNLKINEATQKVLKLAESNLDEKVILTFVQQTPQKFDLDADEIVYLSDVGVPATVIAAMLKHDGDDPSKAETLTAAPNTENVQPALPANTNAANVIAQTQPPPPMIAAPPQQPQQVEVSANYGPAQPVIVQQQPVVVQQPAEPVVVEQAPPVVYAQPETVSYFYDSLSPYGSWFYVTDYGWCWQPTVAVVDHGWRPYGPRGHWVWTDAGWYWASDYSWGWAPFHYGRWYMHGGRGWVWVPDHVWGPSWVTWRGSGDYCGWAPLPPHAVFTPGIGFTYFGHGVDVSFGFGLGWDAFCFAPVNRFGYRHVYDYCLPRHEAVRVYSHSHVANHWEFRDGRREFVNRGVPRVETGARPAVVRTMSERDGRFAGRERVEHTSRETVIYRPPAPPHTSTANPVVAAGSRTTSTGFAQQGGGANWRSGTRAEVSTRPSTANSGIANAAPPQAISPRGGSRGAAESTQAPQVSTRPSTVAGNPAPTPAGRAEVVNPATRGERSAPVASTPFPRSTAPTPPASASGVASAPENNSRIIRPPQVTTAPTPLRSANEPNQPQVINPATRRPLADASSATPTPLPGSPTFNNPPRSVTTAEPAPTRREFTRTIPQPTTPAPEISRPAPTTIAPPVSAPPPRSFNSAPQISAPTRMAPSAPTYTAPAYTPPMRGNAPTPAPSYQAPVSRAPVYQTPISRAPEPRQAPQGNVVSPGRGRGRD
jgi:hypothetical protein